MKRLLTLILLISLWTLGTTALSAQDLVITNARIFVGNGNVIDQGSIVIRAGRIASIGTGGANASGMEANVRSTSWASDEPDVSVQAAAAPAISNKMVVRKMRFMS